MFQCDNCAEWTEDRIWIEWPVWSPEDEPGAIRGYKRYYVCAACLEHLNQWGTGKPDTPEIGSPAAQRDYVKGE